MRRARYQYGTVALKPRSTGSAVWVYRWRETDPQGNSVRKSLILGTLDEVKSRSQALQAAEEHRSRANSKENISSISSLGALIDRFIAEEKLLEARNRSRAVGLIEKDEDFNPEVVDSSTAYGYLSMLKVHIRPKWGSSPISEVKPALVQQWLRNMDVAPKTKGHIKALLHQLFEKAMLWELAPINRNPMQLVRLRGISKRTRKPVVLTADQCMTLISKLPDPYRTMITVAICTGLRVSEILALRWSRVDLDGLTMSVKVKAVNGRVGRVKTECSEDDLPLDPEFAGLLRRWKDLCRKTAGDWVFPSHITDRCFHASPIQQDYIRPAGEQLGLNGVGWHTFRHTYRAWLDATGAPVGVQQKLMRHANISTTMNDYGNALMDSKRDANSKVVRMALQPSIRESSVAQLQ